MIYRLGSQLRSDRSILVLGLTSHPGPDGPPESPGPRPNFVSATPLVHSTGTSRRTPFFGLGGRSRGREFPVEPVLFDDLVRSRENRPFPLDLVGRLLRSLKRVTTLLLTQGHPRSPLAPKLP